MSSAAAGAIAGALFFLPLLVLLIGWRAYKTFRASSAKVISEVTTVIVYITSVFAAIYTGFVSNEQHPGWWYINHNGHWGAMGAVALAMMIVNSIGLGKMLANPPKQSSAQ